LEFRVVAGLVRGDMNATAWSEHEPHTGSDVDLRGVRGDIPAPVLTFRDDLPYGQAIGIKEGSQSKNAKRERERMYKFSSNDLI
jgi:hypothetical protein